MGKDGFGHELNRKTQRTERKISNRIEKETQTLTLGDKGGGAYLRAPPPAIAVRQSTYRRWLADAGPLLRAIEPPRCAGSGRHFHAWA